MRAVKPESSRQLAVVFLAVVLPASLTLIWLGVRLLDQDRILFQQRDLERQEAAADAVARALSQALAEADRRFARGDRVDGAVVLRPLSPVPADPFSEAEILEFDGQPERALRLYGRLARSRDDGVRAGAFIRSARIHRNRGDVEAAAADYRTLAQIDGVAMDGTPVDLLARRALCDLLAEAGHHDDLAGEVEALVRDFGAPRWPLDRDTLDLLTADLTRWTGRPVVPTEDHLVVSAAAGWFERARPRGRNEQFVAPVEPVPVTVLWRETSGAARALAITPSALDGWLATAVSGFPAGALHVSLLDERGGLVSGDTGTSGRVVRRLASETALPWAIVLARGPAWQPSAELPARRRLFMAGLAAVGLLLAGGSYLLWRVVERELAVARLQREFVSAVSHEFRTPVTSLRHVIELLQEDDELTRERRAAFYDVLSRSTERLHRLVESLLDFGRMEGGRRPYELLPVEVEAFAAGVCADFQRDPASRGRPVVLTALPGTPSTILADTAALGHALWNLLDNAVKYSPGCEAITVAVGPYRGNVAISVSDRGIGVPRGERSEIFRKFVRGAQAMRLGIKGTGVGLAIVTHVLRAHGGRVELESEEGRGSTFRLVLPAVP